MSYDNAEPKVLKTLNSSGQVLDDGGNVISDTTSYWEKKYVEAEPKPDKILKSDGSVVDSNGNQIQATNEYNVKKYNQAEPIPAKYLHADGTIDENPGGGGGADLEDNHQTTIDVSTYTQPVEVEPSQGYDGMKKNTVTLTNIPESVSELYYYEKVELDDYLSEPVIVNGFTTEKITHNGNYKLGLRLGEYEEFGEKINIYDIYLGGGGITEDNYVYVEGRATILDDHGHEVPDVTVKVYINKM